MSRYARVNWTKAGCASWVLAILLPWGAASEPARTNSGPSFFPPHTQSRVIIAQDPEATEAYQPRPDKVLTLVHRAILRLADRPSLAEAWLSLVSTQDIVGIKVYSSPGASSGTRPAVVAAVVEGLLEAKLPPQHIIIWDKHRADLRQAGFFELAKRYGIRVEGSATAGYDPDQFYETSLVGQLVWGDSEFGKKGDHLGRRSFVSKLVTQGMTKIINVTPLLNHNSAGVCGNLLSLTLGSVDNTIRFETDVRRLADAVPELYALPVLGDRVVLNIVDALLCQYQGEHVSLLHYSVPLNEVRCSKDPVALDVLSLRELEHQRQATRMPSSTNHFTLYQNASELELGASDWTQIKVERIP